MENPCFFDSCTYTKTFVRLARLKASAQTCLHGRQLERFKFPGRFGTPCRVIPKKTRQTHRIAETSECCCGSLSHLSRRCHICRLRDAAWRRPSTWIQFSCDAERSAHEREYLRTRSARGERARDRLKAERAHEFLRNSR
jgi:hypothetical protein